MTPLEHLGVVEELARNSAPYCEFRTHLIAVQEALESFAALQTEHTKLKEAKTKEIAELTAKYEDLKLRYMELHDSQKQPPPDSGRLPGPGLKH